MKIDVQNLHSGPITIPLNHSPKYFDIRDEDFQVVGKIRGSLTFTLMGDKVFMNGNLEARIRMACVRCLEPVEFSIRKKVTIFYMSSKNRKTGDAMPFDPEDDEVSYYKGLVIIPDNDIRELILVDLPDYPHCKESCKGLCPWCGANLNTGLCECKKEQEVSFTEQESWKEKLKKIHT